MNLVNQSPHTHTDSIIILFDGVCNLCNGAVQFIIRRDPKQHFKFASLQSPSAQALLQTHGIDPATLYSILVLHNGTLYERSDAALHIARHLPSPWPALTLFKILPKKLRDALYNWVATNRYKWFGQRQSCMIPTPDLKSRFLQ